MPDEREGVPIQFARPQELVLLRAALLEKPEAFEAATAWLEAYRAEAGPGFCHLESGSHRLLPLIYRNLKELLPVKTRNELRQTHLEYWSKNQQIFQRLEAVLPLFQSRGVPTLVLKGVALSVLHYRDTAVRPMSDFDILIPEEHARKVILSLQQEGWTSTYFSEKAPQYRYFFRHVHAIPLTHPVHGDLDLHWHVMNDATSRGADRLFWNDSVPLPLNGFASRALNPTDQLLHVCVHGYRANEMAPIRWIADAFTVIRTSQIDWNRLLRLAKQLHLTIPLRAGLAFLRDTFSAAVPMEVIGELASVPVSSSEQRYFERLCYLERNAHEILEDNYERNLRANLGMSPVWRLATLPRQLQLHYNLPRLRDLGSFAFSRLGKRITKMLGQS